MTNPDRELAKQLVQALKVDALVGRLVELDIATPSDARRLANVPVLWGDENRRRVAEWIVAEKLYQLQFGEQADLSSKTPEEQYRWLYRATQVLPLMRWAYEDSVHPTNLATALAARADLDNAIAKARRKTFREVEKV